MDQDPNHQRRHWPLAQNAVDVADGNEGQCARTVMTIGRGYVVMAGIAEKSEHTSGACATTVRYWRGCGQGHWLSQ